MLRGCCKISEALQIFERSASSPVITLFSFANTYLYIGASLSIIQRLIKYIYELWMRVSSCYFSSIYLFILYKCASLHVYGIVVVYFRFFVCLSAFTICHTGHTVHDRHKNKTPNQRLTEYFTLEIPLN